MSNLEDDLLLDYEEEQLDRASKGLPAETVDSAASKLADVSLKPVPRDAVMNDSTPPGESLQAIKLLADAFNGNRIGASLHLIKNLKGNDGPEQVRRWFDEFELITNGCSNEERRRALRIRVEGRAATAMQLMPGDLLDDYEKIKGELLLRLADEEPRRSANLTTLMSGCPRLPNESVEQFGARVHKLARDAMEPNCPLSQIDAIAKEAFIRGLDDEQLLPSLIEQKDHKEFRYLVDHAGTLRRNFDLYGTKRTSGTPTAPTTNKANRQYNAPSHHNAQGNQAAGSCYVPHKSSTPVAYQQRSGPSGSGPGANNANYQDSGNHSESTWVKQPQGQFRSAYVSNPNSAKSTASNAVSANPTVTLGSVFGQCPGTYTASTNTAGKTHNTLGVTLPINTVTAQKVGPCAIGPVPEKEILVEGMAAISLWDTGASVSIAQVGYLRGLFDAKGIDHETWPVDPPSTEISVANGNSLDLVGSTVLQVSIGGEAKPVRVQLTMDVSKGTYVFRVNTAFGPWTSPPRETALLALKTTCGLGPYDHCIAQCRTDCMGVTLRDIAPDATLASDQNLGRLFVPTLAQQVAVCRATRKLHGAALGELCKRLLTNPAEVAEKILATSTHAPFEAPVEDVILAQARLRASRCALTQAALEASGDLPLTFITTSADSNKAYTSLELDDGKVGLYMPGANLMGQAWEEVRNGGINMLSEPFHVICTTAEKPFFEHTAAVVHVAEDQLQKTRFFENNRFSGSCMTALVTLGPATDDKDLFKQLIVAIAKVTHVQVVVMPPPPLGTEAYVYQSKKLMETFPSLYDMTDSGGSMLQVGRYGAHADRRYLLGDKWNKDGILALKAHLVQVCGHHWLRNVPKANATFPLRQLDQLQLGSAGNAPQSQPSTSNRSYNAHLHSTRGGRIHRHSTASRSSSRSTHNFDPQLLNSIISALQPSGSSTKPHRNNPKRK